ncbi:uncharacterized protein LOC18432176 isoform X2 [Amborella trichopoda]|uniref:uncharacterized protein LOC18432176 isoform X2 n=1 Tax=Amborella trichopoda TaxID=13333 RepID=UPI0005D31C63|nr:uncharacterized protein LOC18432176 isoform X2 [Amborella trichopoda]|eukprot:XP_011622601.1 uncharacterized protein LOC18432176 isoform X2 [Amborella trichopoda]
MEDEERREAAMAAASALQPNFQSSSVTEDQLAKLKELRRRRLQIKASAAKSRTLKNLKGASKHKFISQESQTRSAGALAETLSASTVEGTCIKEQEQTPSLTLTKRQKLHWGLDTKERWERKANM